jgi:hypothetical protein
VTRGGIEIFADTRWTSQCRSCGAAIEWATVVASSRPLPFNAPIVLLPDEPALFELAREVQRVDLAQSPSHFSTCPQADAWRRREA